MGNTKSAPWRPYFLTDKKMNNFGRGSEGPSVPNYFHIGPVVFDKKFLMFLGYHANKNTEWN